MMKPIILQKPGPEDWNEKTWSG